MNEPTAESAIHDPELSPKYRDAMNDHRDACLAFEPIRDAYRAGKLDDETFLAAKAKLDDANAAFDVAFAAEADRLEALEAEAEEAGPADPLADHPELFVA